ncbi:Regulatory protein PchR [Mariniflexile rhizosphaerae]|uniref:helix-turn-helix domain-containing protein n=1 Tax=unclassified Mariniflexile TaxID=2643887 RepID=UPI000CBA4CE6|nr:AraC family transcriptional regulator [Mariniflexile sp. TRM1-10]AXP81721.1 Regulatory protein PchR [Mariniflexile sp. TRM1-10]PLB20901.1 MAG: Transcriptional regulator, AraC family [Flavobacteriaceae bacterium FS1-H7996/R]
MEKIRRDNKNFKRLDLIVLNTSLKNYIASETKREAKAGVLFLEYKLLSNFGSGYINEIHFNNVTISISNFVVKSDVTIFNKNENIRLQLSFMLEGGKTIRVNNNINEINYSKQTSYMAYIESYSGYNKIYANSPFKEVKIKLPTTFLSHYKLLEDINFKRMDDNDLIVPMSSDIFSILLDLESNHVKGISSKIFLEAKVLEILAIQIENYKKNKTRSIDVLSNKNVEKLFHLKQFLKENLNKNYTIQQLSIKTGLSENLIKTEFKKLFNCSVNAFFKHEKMNKAKYLLQQTDLPIYQIADDVGYKNATHFSAAFKRFFKENPKSFR